MAKKSFGCTLLKYDTCSCTSPNDERVPALPALRFCLPDRREVVRPEAVTDRSGNRVATSTSLWVCLTEWERQPASAHPGGSPPVFTPQHGPIRRQAGHSFEKDTLSCLHYEKECLMGHNTNFSKYSKVCSLNRIEVNSVSKMWLLQTSEDLDPV